MSSGNEVPALLTRIEESERVLMCLGRVAIPFLRRDDVLAGQKGVLAAGTIVFRLNARGGKMRSVVLRSGLERDIARGVHVSYYVGPPPGPQQQGDRKSKGKVPSEELSIN